MYTKDTFTPERSDGDVDVTFSFDSSKLSSKELVVFEKLYYEGVEVTTHKDILMKETENRKPHVLDQILIYLREAPKYFGGIFLASQSIRDFVPEGSDSDAINKIKTIFGLTQYKFIFHQDMESIPIIESTFSGSLTRSQMDRISKLSTGENVLSISSDSNIEFKVYLSDMENRLFTGGA